MPTTYDYKMSPLGPGIIRLLELDPGKGSEGLLGRFVRYLIAPLDDRSLDPGIVEYGQLKYEALSYTWGSDEGDSPITILEADKPYSIGIKRNLDSALRALRQDESKKFLWVDFLCIDQTNMKEKNSQIPRMAQIYMKASKVRIWLGNEENNSQRVMAFIEQNHKDSGDFDQYFKNFVLENMWPSVLALLQRKWFSRRWVVQELTRASNAILHCGRDSVYWDKFADIISLFQRNREDIKRLIGGSSTNGGNLANLEDLDEFGAVQLIHASNGLFRRTADGSITEPLLSLEALMSSLTAFDATDPRDTVYAILWLVNDATPVTEDTNSWETASREVPSSSGAPPDYSSDDPLDGLMSNSVSTGGASTEHQKQSPTPVLKRGWSASFTEIDEAQSEWRRTSTESGNKVRLLNSGTVVPTQAQKQQESADTSITLSPLKRFLCDPPRLSPADTEKLKTIKAGTKFMDKLRDRRFIVNYEKSVLGVYRDFLEFCVRRSHSLDILCLLWAPIPKEDDDHFPTWIARLSNGAFQRNPDGMNRRVGADPLVGRPGVGPKPYSAARRYPAFWKLEPGNDKCLIVKGFILDTVKETKNPAPKKCIPSDWPEAVNWNDAPGYREPFWRTLVGNRNCQGQKPSSLWGKICEVAFNGKADKEDLDLDSLTSNGSLIMGEFVEGVSCVTFKRKLVLFKRLGISVSVGLAPEAVREGDAVCILYGCSVPVLLRQCDDGEVVEAKCEKRAPEDPIVRYKFIGECYVHGKMDGEAFNEDKDPNFKPSEREFKLI